MTGEVVLECAVLLSERQNENEICSGKLLRSDLLEWLKQADMVWQRIGDSVSCPGINAASMREWRFIAET